MRFGKRYKRQKQNKLNLGQVYTKPDVANFMVSLFTLDDKARVLGPCFGHAVFIQSLLQNTPFQVKGIEIDPLSFSSVEQPPTSRCELQLGNFFDEEELYEGIIMNPPYIRQEEIDNLASMGISKKVLQTSCGLMSIPSKSNMYVYFMLKAVLLLKLGGELVSIFPCSWTNTPVGMDFYKQLNLYGSISKFILVKGEAFENSPMVDVCIIKYVRGRNIATQYQQLEINERAFSLREIANPMSQKKSKLPHLSSFAQIRRGITTGANNIFVNPPLFSTEHLVEILSSPRNVEGFCTAKCKVDKLLAIPKGSVLTQEEDAYLYNHQVAILKNNQPKTLYEQIKQDKIWYNIECPKPADIVFSYIVRNSMKFVINDGDKNVRDNFYMITSLEDPYLLLALLNNYHVYLQLERIGKQYGKGLLKLQKYDIDNIQLPRPNTLAGSDKVKLVEYGHILAKATSKADNVLTDITNLLDGYYSCQDAKEQYYSYKEKRLKKYE